MGTLTFIILLLVVAAAVLKASNRVPLASLSRRVRRALLRSKQLFVSYSRALTLWPEIVARWARILRVEAKYRFYAAMAHILSLAIGADYHERLASLHGIRLPAGGAPTPDELLEKALTLTHEARQVFERAEAENRSMTAEESAQVDTLIDKSTELKDKAARSERLAKAEAELGESRGTTAGQGDTDGEGESGDPEARAGAGAPEDRRGTEAYNRFLRGGMTALGGEELRALQADSAEAGGYVVPPQSFVTDLIKAVDDMLFIRQLATKQTVAKAASLGAASLDADPADADWTAEITSVKQDSTMDFGKRELTPHQLSKELRVANKLLRTAGIDVEALVKDRLAYKFGVTEEKGFMTGSGALQPLGLFTASADGISTGRDISTGNTTTSIQFDGLMEAKYGLKGNYWARASWIFHRDAMKQVAKLKDDEGQYIWRESVRVGEPDRLLGAPIHMSEYAPNTFTTGLYVGMLGDYSFYWIADALDMQVQRLVELYAATNQVGFIGRMEVDGMPVLEEAFARVTLT